MLRRRGNMAATEAYGSEEALVKAWKPEATVAFVFVMMKTCAGP